VQFTLYATADSQVECDFDAAAGSGVVPSQILQQLPKGSASITAISLTQTTARAAELQVAVSAWSTVVFSDDSEFLAGVTLN
jgi:hypothetical protein